MSVFWCHLGSTKFLEHQLWKFSAKDFLVVIFLQGVCRWIGRTILPSHMAYAQLEVDSDCHFLQGLW